MIAKRFVVVCLLLSGTSVGVWWFSSSIRNSNHSTSPSLPSLAGSSRPTPQEVTSCDSNDDCVLINWNPSCPITAVAVNRSAQKHIEVNRLLYGLPPREEFPAAVCGRSTTMPDRAVCKRGECVTRCETIGWNWPSSECTVSDWPPALWPGG